MPTFHYQFSVSAPQGKDADRKLKALSTLCDELSVGELEKLAWIVKNDPVKTALAKKALGV